MSTQYDAVARDYAGRIAPKYRPVAQLVADRAALPESGVVVELAIGTGLLASLLARGLPPSTHYVGVDVAAEMLTIARAELPHRVALTVADVRALPLPDASADLVLSSLGPVQDSAEALSETCRMLRPGGRLVLATWGPSYGELELLQRVRDRLGAGRYDVATPAELQQRVEAAGLVDVTVELEAQTVEHDSMDDYLSYRAAFGRVPWSNSITDDDFRDALRAEAAAYVDARGRVCLGWSFSVITARRPESD